MNDYGMQKMIQAMILLWITDLENDSEFEFMDDKTPRKAREVFHRYASNAEEVDDIALIGYAILTERSIASVVGDMWRYANRKEF